MSEEAEDIKLKLLTYNVGLLTFKICGCITLFANPPFDEIRIPHVPEVLTYNLFILHFLTNFICLFL